MKNSIFDGLILAATLALQFSICSAATTIDSVNHYSYGANIGWLDTRGDLTTGAVIGEYVCFGYIYSANVGWINLGNGLPANQIQYQNNSANDFGVNCDGIGNLRGYAYGANIGWINFENIGAPQVDLSTGNLRGYVWSANCGWISLSNVIAFVQSDSIRQGALAPNGLPIAWLFSNFGTTNINPNADPDGDGQSNLQEYQAGTNPNDAHSNLRITSITHGTSSSTYTTLQWASQNTRFYAIEHRSTLTSDSLWTTYFVLPFLGGNNLGFDDYGGQDLFRIRAFRPLTP